MAIPNTHPNVQAIRWVDAEHAWLVRSRQTGERTAFQQLVAANSFRPKKPRQKLLLSCGKYTHSVCLRIHCVLICAGPSRG